jgi:hypothetical protein
MPEPPATRIGPRLRAVLCGVVLGLCAFELALQIAAFVLWRQAGREGAGRTQRSAQVVLCVGDSFTYGLGASTADHSYPARLQRELDAARPGAFRVVNAGRPGQSSADVLRRLPRQLAEHRPAMVVVLAGYNDRFKKPAAVGPAELDSATGPESFPWRWRSLELAGRVVGALRGDGPGAPPPPSELFGTWAGEGLEVWFGRDGICAVAGVETPYRVDGAALEVGSGEAALRLRWERRGEVLWLAGGSLPAGGVELRAAPTGTGVAARAGRRILEDEAAIDQLDADAVRRACATLRARPEDSPTWWLVAAAAARGIAADEVLATVAVALAAVPTEDPWRAGLLRIRAGILEGRDPDLALASILEAALVDGQIETVAGFLETRAKDDPRAAFERALRRLSPAPAQRTRLEAMFATAIVPDEQLVEVLADHLQRLVVRCRDAGCAARIATYPEREPLVDRAIRRGAAAAGQAPIDLALAFDEALRARPRSELFVMDGHCNDAGYALVAATIAAGLLD